MTLPAHQKEKKEKKNSYGAHHDASVVLWRGL
jgi:hypothetical protein